MKNRSIKDYLVEIVSQLTFDGQPLEYKGADIWVWRGPKFDIYVDSDGGGQYAAYAGDASYPDFIEWGDTPQEALDALSAVIVPEEVESRSKETKWSPGRGHYEE